MTVNNEMKIGHPYSNIFNIFLCPNHKPIQIVYFIEESRFWENMFLPLPHTKIFTYDLLCFS